MKVLHIASGDLWAGAEVQLYHLVRELAATPGFDLLVVLMNEGQLADSLRDSGIRVVIFDEARLSGLEIIFKLFLLVFKYRPTLIHTHRSKENVIGGLVAFFTGRPSVRTVHGASEFDNGPFNLKRVIFRFIDQLIGKVLQKRVIAVSRDLAEKLTQTFPQRKLSIIPNGINIQEVLDKSTAMVDFSYDANKFNIAFVGRFVPVKRPDIFLDIVVDVIAKPCNDSIHFHMFGDGPLWNEIVKKIHEDGYRERINTHGFVSNIAPYLKKMDLLLFTSDHEGLPMTLLEAMALKVAVMSRNLPSIRQVLCGGECGYVLETDDPRDFSAAIERVYKNKSERETKKDKARMNLETRYSIKQIAGQYAKLYREVV